MTKAWNEYIVEDKHEINSSGVVYRVVCPNFGHPALTFIHKIYFLKTKDSFATIVNGLSVLKLFQLSNGELLFS